MRATETNWQQPIPLFHMSSSQTEYPIDVLPDIIKNAIRSYANYGDLDMQTQEALHSGANPPAFLTLPFVGNRTK